MGSMEFRGSGRYIHLGGRTTSSRAKRLAEIASAYTRAELVEERGIGIDTAAEISPLEERGLRLRPAKTLNRRVRRDRGPIGGITRGSWIQTNRSDHRTRTMKE